MYTVSECSTILFRFPDSKCEHCLRGVFQKLFINSFVLFILPTVSCLTKNCAQCHIFSFLANQIQNNNPDLALNLNIPHLAPIPCFLTLGTGYTFSRAFQRFRVFADMLTRQATSQKIPWSVDIKLSCYHTWKTALEKVFWKLWPYWRE